MGRHRISNGETESGKSVRARERIGSVLVTGASGFIGTAVVEALLKSGIRVRAGVRDACSAPGGAEVALIPTLADGAALRRAAEGCDAVVNAAGLAHVFGRNGGDYDAFLRVNAEGTEHALEAAAAAGVPTFVHISSVAVFDGSFSDPVREDTAPNAGTAYGRSKLEGENRVRKAATRHDMWVPILRPAMVYGPRMKGNPLRLFRLVDRRIPLPFGALDAKRSVLYSENLAAAVLLLLERRCRGATTFLIADSPPVVTSEFVRSIGYALNRRVHLLRVPIAWLQLAGRIAGHARRDSRIADAVGRLTSSAFVEPRRLKEDLGFVPPFTTEEGLERTAAWFRSAMRANTSSAASAEPSASGCEGDNPVEAGGAVT